MVNSFTKNVIKANKLINNKSLNKTPTLRIGLFEKKDSAEFELSGRFSVLNNEGVTLLKNVITHYKWTIRIEQNYLPKYSYNIILGRYNEYERAEELSYNFIEKGLGVQIKTVGGKFYFKNNVINDNSQYLVILDNFKSLDDAKKFANTNLSKYKYEIGKEKMKEAGALLEIFDSELEKVCEADNVVRIIPEFFNSELSIYNFIENNPKITSCGVLEFRSNDDGNLIVINELPVEKYVAAVISNEMDVQYPADAFKALSIVVRSKIFASLNTMHENDPYDLCGDSHCLDFKGFLEPSEKILNIVEETYGSILIHNDKAYNSHFNLLCGGYTANFSDSGTAGIVNLEIECYDSVTDRNTIDLSSNKAVEEWINNEPDVLCNPGNNELLIPFKKYFRWEISWTRKELEKIISEKIGAYIGTLYDIVPIKRNKSGRLTDVEILASNKNIILDNEKDIRNILSANELNSSCFYIETEMDDDGFPFIFTLKGAGLGHGVGLCKIGAINMASRNIDYKQILNHYFKGLEIKKIY